MNLIKSLTLVCVHLLLPNASAQSVSETVSTVVRGQASEAKGSALRSQVNDLVALVQAKKLPEAERLAIDLQRKFEALFEPNMRHYSFQSDEEHLEFLASATQEFEWIDWGYKECLQIQAFIAADRRDFEKALHILGIIEEIAPAASSVGIERGYILNQTGRPSDALDAYQRALLLTTRFSSQRMYKALALRGIGFSFIELHKLDEAEGAFLESLKIESNNRVALNELAYIRDLRGKR